MTKKVHYPANCFDCHSHEKGIFCDLVPHEVEEVANFKVCNRYQKGQVLFMEGNPLYGLYCISQGKVKITKTGEKGKESLIAIAGSGDIIGHGSLLTQDFYGQSAMALEETVVCFLDKKYIMKSIRERPQLALRILEKLAKDLGSAESKLFSMREKNVKERLAEVLLILKESYGVKENDRIRIDLKLTREELASMIGTANETLIRCLSELKSDGLIKLEGKIIYILKEKELFTLANVTT